MRAGRSRAATWVHWRGHGDHTPRHGAGLQPAWAVGDAGNLGSFPVLAGIEALTIFVDNDAGATGQRRALEYSRRSTDSRREVFCVVLERQGNDLNDIIGGE